MDLQDRQQVEIDYWKHSIDEAPGSESVHNIINKVSDAANFLACLERVYAPPPQRPQRVLELGGGQGWAACLFKRLNPHCTVVATDISPHAVDSLPKWEYIWRSKVDQAYACTSYATREEDNSVDLVFCFASAHHFAKHDSTLREINRVLRPGGQALYLYEPTTSALLHPLAHWRVNRIRPAVPEDVLISKRILELAGHNGLQARLEYFPSIAKRGPAETLYYAVLGKVGFLQRLLPCTGNFIFTKPGARSAAREGQPVNPGPAETPAPAQSPPPA